MDIETKPIVEVIIIDENNPKIYSKNAILGFSIFFSTIFGAVLLMQNLKDIGKKKEANIILLLSILYTALTVFLVNIPDEPKTMYAYIINLVGGYILVEFFHKKHFKSDIEFRKKKIWKPLIISVLIMVPFVLAAVYSN